MIDGFTRYEVSTRGRVRVRATGKIMSPDLSTEYPSVRLICDNTHKKKRQNIHHLEALAFLPNISECVNHIDGNKANNHISNLEWCTYAQNNKHAYDMGLKKAHLSSERAKAMRKKVDMSWKSHPVIDLTSGKKYESIKSTKEDGFYPGCVQKVCAGNAKTHCGHIFAYAEKVVI